MLTRIVYKVLPNVGKQMEKNNVFSICSVKEQRANAMLAKFALYYSSF